ncbi:MAG: hypothetical protein HC898_11430 [Phycisphaerales bacterium]|nr:hypothetical protein [Phycisphaerales bacterium]
MSRELIIAFLKANKLHPQLSRLVKPKNPPKLRGLRDDTGPNGALSMVVRDVEDVSTIVSEIEQDHKGVPILLKQYLKLNALILGFNVDPAFGYVTDGLILIDLMQTDPRILKNTSGPKASVNCRNDMVDPSSLHEHGVLVNPSALGEGTQQCASTSSQLRKLL